MRRTEHRLALSLWQVVRAPQAAYEVARRFPSSTGFLVTDFLDFHGGLGFIGSAGTCYQGQKAPRQEMRLWS